MISRKLKYICIPFLFCITILITTAFSFWRVDFTASSNSAIGVGQDDIAENYSFNEGSNKYNLKNYTIYLFPSTIYLNLYLDYLNGKSTRKPEEVYGHIYPLLKEDGSIEYDSTGSVQYETSDDSGDENYLTDYLHTGGIYEKTYLTSDTTQIERYYKGVYEDSNWLTRTGAETYLYGDPIYDEVQVSYKKYTSYDEQHNYRNLHLYDRFGFWPKVRKDTGRYMPLKINVDKNFSSGFYEEVVKRPLTDMGDPRGWYCYSFTLWSYVKIIKDGEGKKVGYQAPYYARNDLITNLSTGNKNFYGDGKNVDPALSSFCPTTVSQYFDLMGDFSTYADEEGIIRLFPKFSNGKTYDETNSTVDSSGETNLPCGFLNGGADAMRMAPTYQNSSVFDQHDYYFSYLSELENFNKATNIGVGILPNVLVDSYTSLEFQISTSYGYANWGSGWSNVFYLNQTNLENLVSSYGEGFYNIYIFLESIGSSGSSKTTNLNQLISTLKTADSEDNFFSTLAGKNFYEPLSSTVVNGKSVAIAFEKVRDTRIIMNIPTATPTENYIQTKYELTNQYFRYLSEDVYSTTAGLNVVENINTTRPINDRYQYCYILNGVDFTNANTPNFQIRFQKRYRDNLQFCGTGGISGTEDLAPNVDLIYNPEKINNQGEFTKEQRFINAFEYYFKAEKTLISNGSKTEEQIVFQLKNEEFKGVYDLLLIYIPNEYYSAIVDGRTVLYMDSKNLPKNYITHQAGFYMFAYRQTNVFLKIFANNPNEHYSLPITDENASLNGFLIHSKSFTNNMLLFQKEYALGVPVRDTDLNEGTPDYSKDYLSYTQPSMNKSLAYCINTYIKEWMAKESNAPSTIKRVIIRDHVTGGIVASYKKVKEEDLSLSEKSLCYLENGVYYQLTFEKFNIRKNYVFYITKI